MSNVFLNSYSKFQLESCTILVLYEITLSTLSLFIIFTLHIYSSSLLISFNTLFVSLFSLFFVIFHSNMLDCLCPYLFLILC